MQISKTKRFMSKLKRIATNCHDEAEQQVAELRLLDRLKNFCFWAGKRHDLACHNIKHLAAQIHGGNWASRRMPF